MIAYKYRFHGHSSLRYVYSHGKSERSHLATIKYVVNSHRKNPRVAVVVSKKIIKSAVGRNRIRRRIYEYMRQRLSDLNNIYDIVIIASSAELQNMAYIELTSQLDGLLEAAHLVKFDKS
jgi:ribonuclease P protein component